MDVKKLDGFESKAAEVKADLDSILSETAEYKKKQAPSVAADVMDECMRFARLFREGAVMEHWNLLLEKLHILHRLDDRYAQKIIKGEFELLPVPGFSYIKEHLLSKSFGHKSNLWDILEAISKSRRAGGNPFMVEYKEK